MEYITLGKIVGTFGIKGEVKVYSSSQFSSARYKKGNKVSLFNEKTKDIVTLTIKSYKSNKNIDIISFEEFNNVNDVEKFINYLVQIEKNSATLPTGYYHYGDLKMCNVYDENDNLIGKVKDIEEYASYQTLRISRNKDKDVLVPFVKAFIKNVDLENKKIVIHVLEGLLWK